MALCRYCEAEVTFDSEYRSESGKMIPLEYETYAPHDCPVWKRQNRRYYPCRKCNKEMIYFDEKQKSVNGKWIPISKKTGFPHQCEDYRI